MGRLLRLELSHYMHHEHFKGDWWEKGEEIRSGFQELSDRLLVQVKSRAAQLRTEAEEDTHS